MRDEEYKRKEKEVEEIINKLEKGEVSYEEGEKLLQEGKNLLNELRGILAVGSGKVVIVDDDGGEITEKSAELDRP